MDLRPVEEKATRGKDSYVNDLGLPFKSPASLPDDNDSQALGNERVPLSEFLLLILKISFSSACMLFGVIPIHNYAVFEGQETEAISESLTNVYLKNSIFWLPETLRNPSPAMFISACITFGLAARSYHHLHANDQHQDRFLSVGVKIGLVASVLSSLITKNPFDFKTYMPLAVLVSLTLSSSIHRALSIKPVVARARQKMDLSPGNVESNGIARKS